MRDDEDRPRDASNGADGPTGAAAESWADLVIPDDIRELAADVAAYHRELRQSRRAQRARRLVGRRNTGPLLVLTFASVLAGLIAAMLTVMGPRTVGRLPSAAPLAHPSEADGTVGGLLPEVALTSPVGTVNSRSSALRPAVFALVAKGCGCKTLLDGLAGEAYSERLPLAVVVAATDDSATRSVVDSLDRGSPTLYLDPSGALARSVTGSVPVPASDTATVVVVNRDGTIYDIERNVSDPTETSVDAALQSMLASRS